MTVIAVVGLLSRRHSAWVAIALSIIIQNRIEEYVCRDKEKNL